MATDFTSASIKALRYALSINKSENIKDEVIWNSISIICSLPKETIYTSFNLDITKDDCESNFYWKAKDWSVFIQVDEEEIYISWSEVGSVQISKEYSIPEELPQAIKEIQRRMKNFTEHVNEVNPNWATLYDSQSIPTQIN